MRKAQYPILLLILIALMPILVGCGPSGKASNSLPERRDLRMIEFYSPM
jgi:hypothetical protein